MFVGVVHLFTLASARPQASAARWPHHSLSCGQSLLGGMPRKLKMIVAGSGKVNPETRSNGADESIRCPTACLIARRIRGSICIHSSRA